MKFARGSGVCLDGDFTENIQEGSRVILGSDGDEPAGAQVLVGKVVTVGQRLRDQGSDTILFTVDRWRQRCWPTKHCKLIDRKLLSLLQNVKDHAYNVDLLVPGMTAPNVVCGVSFWIWVQRAGMAHMIGSRIVFDEDRVNEILGHDKSSFKEKYYIADCPVMWKEAVETTHDLPPDGDGTARYVKGIDDTAFRIKGLWRRGSPDGEVIVNTRDRIVFNHIIRGNGYAEISKATYSGNVEAMRYALLVYLAGGKRGEEPIKAKAWKIIDGLTKETWHESREAFMKLHLPRELNQGVYDVIKEALHKLRVTNSLIVPNLKIAYRLRDEVNRCIEELEKDNTVGTLHNWLREPLKG